MKKTRFTETQIVSILKQHEAGKSVKDIIREHGISDATFYNWKAKYGGMEASDVKRMKDLEQENNCLKRIIGNMTLEWMLLNMSWKTVRRPADKWEAVSMMVTDKQVSVRQACNRIAAEISLFPVFRTGQ